MSGSHPPTLITHAKRLLRDEVHLERGTGVIVAVSGGPDSMALLHVLAHLRSTFGINLFAHGVDHGLRPQATGELDLAEGLAGRLNVPFERTHVNVPQGGNLQARAREARFEALRAAAARCAASLIATAHHADDRAETLILRLLRGSGPQGLAVLPPRSGDLIRPFLRARRADILAHIARHHLPHANDPSNENPKFTRVRVRQEVMPLLSSLNPAIVENLCALADLLGDGVRNRAQISGETVSDLVEGHSHMLPRSTRLALKKLGAPTPSSGKTATVELPRGLVATYDHDQHKIVTERSTAPRWKQRNGNGRHQNGE